jgi:hypothetical protein
MSRSLRTAKIESSAGSSGRPSSVRVTCASTNSALAGFAPFPIDRTSRR